MSDLERDLQADLARRAGEVDPAPADWDDLTARMTRRDRRARAWLTTGLVVALVAGPLAGFAVARSVQDDDGSRITAGAGNGDGVATEESSAALSRSDYFPGIAMGMPGMPVEKLFRRTTADGVVVRGFTTPVPASPCQGDGWCPPPECYPNAQVTGQLSTDEAIGYAWGGRYGGEVPSLRVTGGGTFGTNGEGSPARWVTAQAGRDVASVRVTFEDGGTDEMEPVDGVVILAARADAEKAGAKVEALDRSGAVVESVDQLEGAIGYDRVALFTVTGEGATPTSPTTVMTPPPGDENAGWTAVSGPMTAIPDGAPQCQPPPPALPAPGEQPADPDAARAEVTAAFATAYDGGVGADEAKRAAVEDSDALAGTMEEVRNGSFAQQAKDAKAVVTEIVFISPTEAAVRYDIKIKDYTNFDGRIGRAKLIDGRWKVARVTVCADLGLAGGTCPAG